MASIKLVIDNYNGQYSIIDTHLISKPQHYFSESGNNNVRFFCEYFAPGGNVGVIFPDDPCSLINYSGDILSNFDLIITDSYNIFSGDILNIDLTIPILIYYYPSAQNDITFFCEYFAPDGNVDVIFPDTPCAAISLIIGSSGSILEIDLLNIDSYNIFSGELVNVNLNTYLNIQSIDFYSDEYVYTSLSSEYSLGIDLFVGELLDTNFIVPIVAYLNTNNYSDESFSLILITIPPIIFDYNIYGSENYNVLLSTTTKLFGIVYVGEYSNYTLNTTESQPIYINGYTGNYSNFDIKISINLSTIKGYFGQYANISEMSNEPNIYIYTDQTVNCELSTSYIININCYDTTKCIIETEIKESKPLGIINFYNGTKLLGNIKTQYHAEFYVLFRSSVHTQLDIGSTTNFDLVSDECCRIRTKSSNLLIGLERGQKPEEYSHGSTRLFFDFELYRRSRFNFDFYSGELSDFTEKDFLELNFIQDTHSLFVDFDANLRHRLCKGYFIPNAEWVIIELNDILLENCYTDRFYSGELLKCIVSDDIILQIQEIKIDQILITTLTTDTPWLLLAYSGERLKFDFPWTLNNNIAGETLDIKLYNEPINIFVGEIVESELSVEYKVKFIDIDCLDNEFVWQTIDGDLIPELFNPIPVEGEPYKHDILTQCY